MLTRNQLPELEVAKERKQFLERNAMMLCWMVGNTNVQIMDLDNVEDHHDTSIEKIMKSAINSFSWNSEMLVFLARKPNLNVFKSMLIISYCVGTDTDETI
jgi:hypothetical protein